MRLSYLLSLSLFLTTSLQAAIEWRSDYANAVVQNQQEGKPILIFFNGSDWAGSAMKMKHEILDTPTFQEKIGSCFVCLEADFPKYTPQNRSLEEQNVALKTRFNVQDFPCLLLLDASERVIARLGYLPESGEQLARDLLKIVEQDTELASGLKHLDHPSSVQLKKLYQLALELGDGDAMERIISEGVKQEDPFLCLERYRLLVEKGEMKSEEALSLRQRLMRDESPLVNEQSIPFTIALIDFQELSQANEPELTVQPLIDYLDCHGQTDQKNGWRVEMMIAEVYLDAGKWEKALKHAQRAYASAPEVMHKEIAHTLKYIQSAPQISR